MATICMHHVLASMDALAGSHSRERLLIRAGINPRLTDDSTRRIHTDQVARLFKIVQLELGDEFMGFTRTACRVGAFKIMCDLVKHCRNLFELIEKSTDFYKLLSDDIEMNARVSGTRAIFSIEHRCEEKDPAHFLREFLLVIWHRFPSWFINEPIRLRETQFSFAKPSHHEELQVMFPGPLRYGQSANRLVFDRHYLDRPLVRTSSEVDFFARNAPADVMTIPGLDNSLERQIERLVVALDADKLAFPRIESVAEDLGMSPQSLYRKLKASGTSYQKIKDDIRRETAIRWLVEEDLPVEKVSELVGFSEARSFTRAFRQWTGMSPRRYRNSIRHQSLAD